MLIIFHFIACWCWTVLFHSLVSGSSQLVKRDPQMNPRPGLQRVHLPRPQARPQVGPLRAQPLVHTWRQYNFKDPNFAQESVRESNRWFLRRANGSCIYREFPVGRPPTISDLSQVDVPVKTPLFVDRLLQPAYVLNKVNNLTWTQHFEKSYDTSYRRLVELFNQTEPDPALKSLMNDPALNSIGCDERICQLKEIGLTTRFDSFDWSTVSQQEALNLATYLEVTDKLYTAALDGLTAVLEKKEFSTFLLQRVSQGLQEDLGEARTAIYVQLFKAHFRQGNFGEGGPGPKNWV